MKFIWALSVMAVALCQADDVDEKEVYEVPSCEGFHLCETFQSSLEDSTWKTSSHEKFTEGTWGLTSELGARRLETEQGLVVLQEAKHAAISSKFAEPLVVKDHDALVIQYDVRFHQTHNCGGAYMKVIKENGSYKPSTWNDEDEYVIMFGPDKCGATDKVHLIIRYENKISKKVQEKHLVNPPAIRQDLLTHLYTVVIRRDNTYEILIDQESHKTGSLLTDFEPPLLPTKEIDDPEDSKPDTWVDDAMINDPEVFKPDDWDEDAPRTIDDEAAEKPEGWGDDEELEIPDPEAERPEDWDDEDDGTWEAPTIANPICVNVGCGEWKRPQIPNPEYKGPWIHPQIDNPDYIGEWKPRKIPNPNYYEDDTPYDSISTMAGVGIEIWTMQKNIEFDNVLIGFDQDAAKSFSTNSWAKKIDAEIGDVGSNGASVFSWFTDAYADHPGAVILTGVVGLITVLAFFSYCCCNKSAVSEEQKAEDEDEEVDNKGEEEDDDNHDEEEEEEEATPMKKAATRRSTRSRSKKAE